MDSNSHQLDQSFWDERFETNDTPWDIGQVSTPVKEFIDRLENKDQAILIPGCGNSHEAAYLLQQGFTNITVVDISSVLTLSLQKKFAAYSGKQIHIVNSNFFAINGTFDLILEQTFFCALDPSLRVQYANKMSQLLNKGGHLAGLLFNRVFPTPGPPFGGDMDEYRQLFKPLFRIIKLEACYNSIKPRAGTECFFILEKM